VREHGPRVDAFGRAFVVSVTGSVDDYRAATDYVLARFGKDGEQAHVRFDDLAPLRAG